MIYLDNAATSWPKPSKLCEAIMDCINTYCANPGRSGHILSLRASKAIYECREAVCKLFSCDIPERVIFTQNTTYALNTAIKGLVPKNSHVLISNLEHNSVLRPLHSLKSVGVSYSMFDACDNDDEEIIYCFKRGIRDNTKTAVVTAASNVCGKILPIEKIALVCKARGIRLIVDGAQAGGVFPFDFSRSGADILCIAGHKGLYGPQGTGIMICSERCEPKSLAQGGNGINSKEREMGGVLPEKLEAGTVNTPGICGLCEGIKYVMSETTEEIFGRTLLLTAYATQGILSCKNTVIYGNYDIKAPIILFNKKGIEPEKLSAYLADNGVCTRSGFHCAPTAHDALGSGDTGGVRISFGHNNTKAEVDRFLYLLNRA